MKGSETLKQYRARVKREAILKSIFIGVTVGAAAASIIEFICWFVGFKAGLYIALGALVLLAAVVAAIVYVKKFKPTTKAVAARIDELGLEERVLTMIDLEGDDSYIAKLQREDTEKSLSKLNHMLIKFALATSLIIAVSVSAFVAVGMTTVSGLAYADVIPSGLDLIGKDLNTYFVNYASRDLTMGNVYYVTSHWEEPQLFTEKTKVVEGEDAPAVIAVANKGFIFVTWSDGNVNPIRQDASLHGNVDVFAIFQSVEDSFDDDADPENDALSAPPPDQSYKQDEGQQGNKGDKEGDQVVNQRPGDQPGDGDEIGNSGYSGKRDDIIDGNTYYGHNYDESVDEASGSMNDGNVSDKYKDAVSGYLDALNPGGNGEGGEGSNGGN